MIGWVAILAAQAAPAAGQPAMPPAVVAVPGIAVQPAPLPSAAAGGDDLLTAEVWLTQNRLEAARQLLVALEKTPATQLARRNQVQFLLGLLDMLDADYASAIDRFRRILDSEPNAVRVRLEMGRAYFLAGRYAEAERQFLYARAGTLPPAVRVNIDRYLGQIRQSEAFTWGFSLAMAPDTNLNAGPATDAITLYGLPFQLSSDAKANVGVGMVLDANAEWAPRLGPRLKWRFGSQWHRTQYGATGFDDMSLTGFTGPHLTLRRWDINLLGNFSRRWYGDRGYAQTYGSSLDASYFLTPRLGVGANANLARINYDQNPGESGLGGSIGLFGFYTPTPSSYVRGALSLGRQDAHDRAYAFHSGQIGLNYVREFRGGITLGLSPAFTRISYEAPLLAFGKIRRDNQLTAQISLLDRRLYFHGMIPRVAYSYTRGASNIALYRFNRNHFEIGITKAF